MPPGLSGYVEADRHVVDLGAQVLDVVDNDDDFGIGWEFGEHGRWIGVGGAGGNGGAFP